MDPLYSIVAQKYKNFGDTELYKELEKRTNVKAEFIHPAVGQEIEQFNLMLAANNIPDVIEYVWANPSSSTACGYPGGPEQAIKDGTIIRLNDLIKNYAPNFQKILNEHPDWEKVYRTDSGAYCFFPFARGDVSLQTIMGPIVRKDWLDELGIKEPTTIDDWHNMLKAFKDKKGATAPLRITQNDLFYSSAFIGAYGVTPSFYLENNKVEYGPIQPGYKNFMELFKNWYSEGLIDQDFAVNANNAKALDALITEENAGALVSAPGGGIGKYMTLMKDKKPKFTLAGVVYPTIKAGDKPKFGNYGPAIDVNGFHFAITSANKHPVETTKWLDYGYSEAGHMLFNFGIEGVTYNMVDGYPKYTDLIIKNPQGLSMAQVMVGYMRSSYNGPFVQDKRYIEQYYALPVQKEAISIWAKVDHSGLMPPVAPTSEESKTIAKIMNEVNTYVSEMFYKFIMGVESLDKYDEYVAKVKKMGIDNIVKIEQTALERYNKR